MVIRFTTLKTNEEVNLKAVNEYEVGGKRNIIIFEDGKKINFSDLKRYLMREYKARYKSIDWSLVEEEQSKVEKPVKKDRSSKEKPAIEKPPTKLYTPEKEGGDKDARVEGHIADSEIKRVEELEGALPETPTEEQPATVPQAGEHGDVGAGDQHIGGEGMGSGVPGESRVGTAGENKGAGGGSSEGVGSGGTPERAGGERGLNYRINTQDDLGGGTPKKAFGDNVEAVKLLKKIESENRKATADEQKNPC